MKKAARQFRPGFIGIDLLIAGIVVLVITAGLAHYANSPDPGSPKAPAPIPISGTAQTVTDTASAGAAVLRLAKEASTDAPDAVPAPVIDAPVPDPEAGESFFELLQAIIDGL